MAGPPCPLLGPLPAMALGTLVFTAGRLGLPSGVSARTATEEETRHREPRGGSLPRQGCTSV